MAGFVSPTSAIAVRLIGVRRQNGAVACARENSGKILLLHGGAKLIYA